MKKGGALILIVLLIGGGACKMTAMHEQSTPVPARSSTTEEVVQSPAAEKFIGRIEFKDDCGYLIRIEQEGVTGIYQPNNLDSLLQKVGMRVKFSFEETGRKLPPSCEDAKSIHLKYITALR